MYNIGSQAIVHCKSVETQTSISYCDVGVQCTLLNVPDDSSESYDVSSDADSHGSQYEDYELSEEYVTKYCIAGNIGGKRFGDPLLLVAT